MTDLPSPAWLAVVLIPILVLLVVDSPAKALGLLVTLPALLLGMTALAMLGYGLVATCVRFVVGGCRAVAADAHRSD